MFSLLWQNIKSLFKSEKIVFVLFFLGVIVSTITLFYSFGEVYNYVAELQDVNEECRTFVISPDGNERFENIKNKVDTVIGKFPDTENIKLTLEDDVTYSYYYGSEKFVNLGSSFSDDGKPEIIIGDLISQDKIGDYYTVGDEDFLITGKRSNTAFNEVNYKGLSAGTMVSDIEVEFPLIPGRHKTEKIMNELSGIFSGYSLRRPTEFDTVRSILGSDKFYIAIVLILMSLISISFLYRYLIVKRKNIYAIYQICGCRKSKCVFFILSELLLITLVPFLAGVLIYKLLVERLVINELVYAHKVGIVQILGIAMMFFVLMMIVFLPFIIKFSRQSPKEIRYSNMK